MSESAIRTILARKIKEARALQRAEYLFEGDDFENGARHGSDSARLEVLLELVAAITPQRYNQHIKWYRHMKRNAFV